MKKLIHNLTLLIFACVTIPGKASADEISSPKQAIATLRQIWEADLSKSLTASPHYSLLKKQIYEPGKVGAWRITSAEASKETSRLLKGYEATFILVGNKTALKINQPVWVVSNPGDFGNGFEAYIDQKTGKLLFLWIIPEG